MQKNFDFYLLALHRPAWIFIEMMMIFQMPPTFHMARSNVGAESIVGGGGYDLVRWSDCRLRPRLSGKKGSSKFQPRDSAANRLR